MRISYQFMDHEICLDELREQNGKDLVLTLADDMENGAHLYRELIRYAASIVGENNADDILSEFHLKLANGSARHFSYKIHRSSGISGNPKIRPWAFACVNRMCVDFLRREESRGRSSLRSLERFSFNTDGEEISGEGIFLRRENDPRRGAEESEEREILYHSLKRITQGYEELELFLGGKTYGEIANIRGIQIGTVKSRIFRAREELLRETEQYRKAS